MTNNKPLFILWIKPKNGKGAWVQGGAVFNGKFDMSLVINQGVVLTSDLTEKCWLTLKPYEESKNQRVPAPVSGSRPERVEEEDPTAGWGKDADEDIPF